MKNTSATLQSSAFEVQKADVSQAALSEVSPETKVEEYLKLFLAFRALPETKRRSTFMEISRYPHYENVCSNILSFYFDPTAEHGLKNLLLASFLHMAGEGEIVIPECLTLEREYPAGDQQRIDIVINCDNFTLGIENKIFHWEANDFENYGRIVDSLGRNKKKIKAVLCLSKTDSQGDLPGGFKRYTYGEFWKEVRSRLGNSISDADPKWVTCLLDFMETTANLAGYNMDHKKLDQFFIDNNEIIERLVGEHNAFYVRLNQKVAQLSALMQETKEAKLLSSPPWVYQKACLVLDFKFKDQFKIAFDLILGPKGWKLQLFARDSKSLGYFSNLIAQPDLSAQVGIAPIVDERYIVQTWPIDTDPGEIREALQSWIRNLIAASASEPIASM